MERFLVGRGVVTLIRSESGTSLLEVLVALLLIAMGALSVAPMFVSSADSNAADAGISSLTSMATARMEALRALAFQNITPGGSLTSNVTNYSDATDPDFVLRWEIIDGGGPTGTRTVRLIAFAPSQLASQPESVELTSLRSR